MIIIIIRIIRIIIIKKKKVKRKKGKKKNKKNRPLHVSCDGFSVTTTSDDFVSTELILDVVGQNFLEFVSVGEAV